MQSTEPEIWKPVVGYEGHYEVSNLGRVRSLDRVVIRSNGRRHRNRGRVLSQVLNEHGYPTTSLSRSGKSRRSLTHRLVLTAFVGPCPPDMEGCHNDGNPANPNLTNLRWDTKINNAADRKRHGTDRPSTLKACPRGHLLQKPNLVASGLNAGYRDCLACNRSRGFAQSRGIEWTPSLADQYYAQIINNPASPERPHITRSPLIDYSRRKSHCINGHPFTERNTRYLADGSRSCRRCHADEEARRRTRVRQARTDISNRPDDVQAITETREL